MSPAGAAQLKILVLNWLDRENPQAGGAEAHLHEVFGRLARRGHSVEVLASGWPGSAARTTLDGLAIHRVGGRHTFSVAAPSYYRKRLRHEGFDVVVEDVNKVPLFAPLWTRTRVVLLVHHLFGSTAFEEASFPIAAATWLLERPLRLVFGGRPAVAVSESTRQDLVRRGFEAADVEVIPNGIDLDVYTPDPEGHRYPDPAVLYLGRLKRYKRVDLILEAVARLALWMPSLRLLIAGRGDAELALHSRARELRIDSRVEFLGYVSEAKKLELLRRSWVHVLASPKEGWGIANLEAAACGTPTVASDSPGLRDSVRDGETGFLVPHGDPVPLADRIGTVLRDRPLRKRLGQGARRFAEGFSWDASADAMEALLRRVVGPSRQG